MCPAASAEALRSLRRCGDGGWSVPCPRSSAPTSWVPMYRPLPHLHQDWARPCQICTGIGPTPVTSQQGLGSPVSHLHRDWAHPATASTGMGSCTRICAGTGRNWAQLPPASARGLGSPLHRDWALGPCLPHLHRDGSPACQCEVRAVAPCVLHVAGVSVRRAHCALHAAGVIMHLARCMLPASCCILKVARCMLPASSCTLRVACCRRHVAS